MTAYQIRVDDKMRFQVYRTINGIYRIDVGPAWLTSKQACSYVDTLAEMPDLRPLRSGPESTLTEAAGPDAVRTAQARTGSLDGGVMGQRR